MLNRLIIKDKSKLFYNYVEHLDLPEEIEFKPGLNILIGPNGCGKTTVLNLIRRYAHCFKKYVSDPVNDKLITNYRGTFQDGADLIADYTKPVFNLRDSSSLEEHESLESFQNFTQNYVRRSHSSGEDKHFTMATLMKTMFEEDHISEFNLLDKFDGEIGEYYKRNHVPGDAFTVLMDEPDSNFDIKKLSELHKMLSFSRKDTQLIVVLHNPALIYKLKGNFIEFVPGYLDKIKEFIEK